MNIGQQQEDFDKKKVDDIEYRLIQLDETLSSLQDQLHEERRMVQSSRLSISVIVISIVILLGLAILYFGSSLHTLSSVIFHAGCLAGIGIVIALLCTVLPRSKKNR